MCGCGCFCPLSLLLGEDGVVADPAGVVVVVMGPEAGALGGGDGGQLLQDQATREFGRFES